MPLPPTVFFFSHPHTCMKENGVRAAPTPLSSACKLREFGISCRPLFIALRTPPLHWKETNLLEKSQLTYSLNFKLSLHLGNTRFLKHSMHLSFVSMGSIYFNLELPVEITKKIIRHVTGMENILSHSTVVRPPLLWLYFCHLSDQSLDS